MYTQTFSPTIHTNSFTKMNRPRSDFGECDSESGNSNNDKYKQTMLSNYQHHLA